MLNTGINSGTRYGMVKKSGPTYHGKKCCNFFTNKSGWMACAKGHR